jgi:pyrimidine-specific ribonucleoside hydrolase
MVFIRLAICLVLLGIAGSVAPVSAQDASPVASEGPIPVVIDSDMTSDDWMATLLLLNDPNYEVVAITVSGTGFAFCDAGVASALGILALAEYDDVPVSCGSEMPMLGENAPPYEWRTTMDTVAGLGLPEGGEADPRDAVTLFTETIQESAEPVTVLALGPLTNVGEALETNPDLVENITMVYLMGGAVDVEGSYVSDTNTTAEWNIYCDPHSARLTFESGVPLTLIGLDATNEVPVTPEFVERLNAEKASPEAEFVSTLMANNAESIESGGYFFWDPLAAVIMIDPSLGTLTERDVTVIDRPSDPEDGRTKPVANGSTILVVTEPDSAAVEDMLIAGWNG